ncbi:MAG: sensor histidine kinase [Epulopiscium sp.]|nr:sensor histidine kinase [Candidatus Epulonipiscium sp.]
MKIIKTLSNMDLKKQLIIAFIAFIIFPSLFIGIILMKFSTNKIKELAISSAIRNNEQVIKNIDGFLEMVIKLSEQPISDPQMNAILHKDYSSLSYPEYETSNDFDAAGRFIYQKIVSYSDLIDSVILYSAASNKVSGRVPVDYINIHYLETKFYQEPWIQKTMNKGGEYSIIGIHQECLLSPQKKHVISVGRNVIEPGTNNSLGIILINIDVEKLEKLWLDIETTENSRFYLIDEDNNIIFSKIKSEINKKTSSVFGQEILFNDKTAQSMMLLDQKVYLISSLSSLSKWKVVSIIPQNELFSFAQIMLKIIIFSIVGAIAFSIIIAVVIATGITKPLFKLNRKMREVAAGNLNVAIDIQGGQIGEISKTVDTMLKEIRRLIQQIYQEEEKKRKAEMLALQTQINPHFIYNTLNVIKLMASMQGVKSIENALTSFSNLMAFTVKGEASYINIKEEVRFIQDYLAILDLRYYNKFKVQYDIDEEVYQYKTLKFLLQPIVENAVFHGFDNIDRKGELQIQIYKEEKSIIFQVKDNGKGMKDNTIQSLFLQSQKKFSGVGISNVYERLKLHFGSPYGIFITSQLGEGSVVMIKIPLIRSEKNENIDC